jgi:hypothetical protein
VETTKYLSFRLESIVFDRFRITDNSNPVFCPLVFVFVPIKKYENKNNLAVFRSFSSLPRHSKSLFATREAPSGLGPTHSYYSRPQTLGSSPKQLSVSVVTSALWWGTCALKYFISHPGCKDNGPDLFD